MSNNSEQSKTQPEQFIMIGIIILIVAWSIYNYALYQLKIPF